jgi:diguanylate cyclase (GGDEF)-like protein
MAELPGQLTLVVCENVRREVLAVLSQEQWGAVRVVSFVPRGGERGTGLVELLGQTAEAPGRGEQVEILAGMCFRAAQVGLPNRTRFRLHLVEHCAQLFLPREMVQRYLARGVRLLLPREIVEPHNGCTPREAAACPFLAPERPSGLVLLDSGIDPNVGLAFEAFARQMRLPAEVLPVGLDTLRLHLGNLVQEWRLEQERRRLTASLSEAIRRSSDHALALDLIGELAAVATEGEVIERMLDLFTLLFTPGRLTYLSWRRGHPGPGYGRPGPPGEPELQALAQADLARDYGWLPSGKGFLLRVHHQDEVLGLLEVDELALPAYGEHYLKLGLILSKVCGLAIAQARSYERERRAQERLRHQAYHDPLTGLPNRLFFYEQAEDALARARAEERGLALLFVDLDGFKPVNDAFGHEMGDALLKEVAGRLVRSVRNGDIVARLGGDEFLVLLREVASPEDAEVVARRILANLRSPFRKGEQEICSSASIGIALYPDHGEDVQSLMLQADGAMYQAKQAGRDRYVVAVPMESGSGENVPR